MEEKFTLDSIGRIGSFLYQLDDGRTGIRQNIWSGKLSANNGYPEEHAERAARLFAAAPAMHEVLRKLDEAARWSRNALDFSQRVDLFIEEARSALSLASEGKQ